MALIFGVAGACRGNELVQVSVNDVKDTGSEIIVDVKNTKNKIDRTFVIKNGEDNNSLIKHVEICRKYMALRKSQTPHSRFFVYYKDAKCSVQPVGKNTFGKLPQNIASFLKLPDASLYTGHCFRRTSASLLANSGATVDILKRHGGWKSATVAEGYVESSINNKKSIADTILGHKNRPISPLADGTSSPSLNRNSDPLFTSVCSSSTSSSISDINNRVFSLVNCNNVNITCHFNNSTNKD